MVDEAVKCMYVAHITVVKRKGLKEVSLLELEKCSRFI
jgi:hypothetical protein